jgi:hypothetical protein
MGGPRHSHNLRQCAREMYAAGDKLEYIAVVLGVPYGTVREWAKDLPRRRGPRPQWCPPHLLQYNKNLGSYWKVPLPLRKHIIAILDERSPMTKYERRRVMRTVIEQQGGL